MAQFIKVRLIKTLLLLSYTIVVIAQSEDINWVFGSNCGMNFMDTSNPSIFESSALNFEASASISDSNGNLLFYLSNTSLLNANNDIIINGMDINISGTYARGLLIIPFSKESPRYHVFHVGEYEPDDSSDVIEHLFHTIVDMSEDGGNGKVLIKNELLLDKKLNEGIDAVRHNNGEDWWLLMHENGNSLDSLCTRRYFKFLVIKGSILGPFIQDIGHDDCSDRYPGGQVKFSHSGKQMFYIDYVDKVTSVYDFDRCSGELSNYRSVDINIPSYGIEVSPNDQYLYITEVDDQVGTNALHQYNLRSSDIKSSRITIARNLPDIEDMGQVLLARNNKIYISSWSTQGLSNHLSVIDHPDSLGVKCGFHPLSFFLGEFSFSFADLPNMPNYQLMKEDGEPCTTAIVPGMNTRIDIKAYPNPMSQYFYIENGSDFSTLEIFDSSSKNVLTFNPPPGDGRIDTHHLIPGIYILRAVQSNSKSVYARIVKY